MKTFNKVTLMALVGVAAAFGQATTTSTTFSASVSGPSATAPAPTQVCLTSSTGVSAPSFGNPAQTALFADHEFMVVLAATGSANCWIVARGQAGTPPYAHSTTTTVWVGPDGGGANSSGLMGFSPFIQNEPEGGAGSPCTPTALPYTSLIVAAQLPSKPLNGSIWSCPATGPDASKWVEYIPPSAGSSQAGPYIVLGTSSANNAYTISLPGIPLVDGLLVMMELDGTHTLQAGANTVVYNGGSAKSLKSHFNTANNLGTAYAATGTILMKWDATLGGWVDMSE